MQPVAETLRSTFVRLGSAIRIRRRGVPPAAGAPLTADASPEPSSGSDATEEPKPATSPSEQPPADHGAVRREVRDAFGSLATLASAWGDDATRLPRQVRHWASQRRSRSAPGPRAHEPATTTPAPPEPVEPESTAPVQRPPTDRPPEPIEPVEPESTAPVQRPPTDRPPAITSDERRPPVPTPGADQQAVTDTQRADTQEDRPGTKESSGRLQADEPPVANRAERRRVDQRILNLRREIERNLATFDEDEQQGRAEAPVDPRTPRVQELAEATTRRRAAEQQCDELRAALAASAQRIAELEADLGRRRAIDELFSWEIVERDPPPPASTP